MQRYFVEKQLNINDEFIIDKDDLHHISKVMRNKNGDAITCIDENQTNYLCTILDINEGIIKCEEILDINNELDVDITLIYALPKGDKFDLVLQKACELGVKQIVPLITSRCVVKTNHEKFSKKLPRYQKILKEASEQSIRNIVPKIHNVIKLKEIDKYLSKHNLVAYEEIAKQNQHGQLYQTINALKPNDTITIIVGSEGGFDQNEIDYLNSKGVLSCSLGKRILRSETAPLYMISVIGYSREVK